MPFNPYAAAFALGGLLVLMVEPEPSWEGIAIGVSCTLAFGTASLLSRGQNVRKDRQPAIVTTASEAAASAASRSAPALGVPAGWRGTGPHPSLLATAPKLGAPP